MSESHHPEPSGRYFYVLALTALGVVYGDIGTSPIYAIREALGEHYGLSPSRDNVLGVLSLIFWALVIVISIKYLLFVMRADNRGEGGMIALTALVAPPRRMRVGSRRWTLVLVGLFGASLLYGDSMITPAISVLSAVEGLEVATPLFRPYILPITITILVGLFAVQSRGTAGIGRVFGPVTLLWFATLGALGLNQVVRRPEVFLALNPVHGAEFFIRNGWPGFLVLGSVFLVVTGGEALYADMGHFGKKPIQVTWFFIVLPCLFLNYFGQGALIIGDPKAIEHPFFLMAPKWALYPLVGLTTMATVIASQAVISGAFSLTRQAVQLGYLPRLRIEHTSERQIGQIYIPSINWLLMLACIGLVLGFRTSSNLAAAYGVAVTTDMVFTTILFAFVARDKFGWSMWRVVALAAAFLFVDLGFWGANLVKIPHGGWFPLVIAAVFFTAFTTWKKGRQILADRMQHNVLPIDLFMADLNESTYVRVPGTAVYMYGNAAGTPPALLHNLMHNKVLHERVVLLTVETEEIPVVDAGDRVTVKEIGNGVFRVGLRYGFKEDPDIPQALALVNRPDLPLKTMSTSYFLGRETLIASRTPGMAIWREKLFSVMSRNARPATAYFGLPPNRVVELGAQIEL
ncbi:KUP/HAK/KT family potassium transporter [Longimicrobium terrae]|uniref:Probable potassium transport system protein Kup n=1 Tax=Longimicrobium terrae TaxID=1639882 RepID=A0A841H475_9BACT|nr:KUP system potassium uptake protein [Longimicrobium terrae]MBB6072794.1 KUP system potassium uptake protein [Longimicrobium terrae]